MLWGGDIEQINFSQGSNQATALFVNGKACNRYLEDTANSIEYKGKTVFVERAKDVEPLVGRAKQIAESGFTRCVQAINISPYMIVGPLNKLGKATGEQEHFVLCEKTDKTPRKAIWRFCSMEAANKFQMALQKNEDFKGTTISFAADPCAKAIGVHE